MISQVLFFIAAVCLVVVVVVLLIMLANQVRADDTEEDLGLCLTYHYEPACKKIHDQIIIEKIMNETSEIWK